MISNTFSLSPQGYQEDVERRTWAKLRTEIEKEAIHGAQASFMSYRSVYSFLIPRCTFHLLSMVSCARHYLNGTETVRQVPVCSMSFLALLSET
ncbi:hypothetical protein BKA93DRAFT_219259 [Sparassis latifolia]